MAEDKKSFVLYSDLIHTVKKMNPSDAGELFLHVLEYVNDKYPATENMIVELTFEPIKQQLKRDLDKWDLIRGKRSDAGKKSAEKRKKKKEIEQNPTNPTHVDSVEQTSTNPTVSVSVNVNDTVNDIIKKSVDKEKLPIFKEWFDYRKEIKKPIKGISALNKVINKFNSMALQICIDTVNYSIENNYQGLIWDKYTNNGTTSNTSNNSNRPHEIGRQDFTKDS